MAPREAVLAQASDDHYRKLAAQRQPLIMSTNSVAHAKETLHILASKGVDLARSESKKKRRGQEAAATSQSPCDDDPSVIVAPRTTAASKDEHGQQHSPELTDTLKAPAAVDLSSADDEQTVPVKQYSDWDLPSRQASDNTSHYESNQTHLPPSNPDTPPPESEIPVSSGPEDEMAEKYVLRIAAGPSYDTSTHVPVPVNVGQPTLISGKSMDILLHVRIRDFSGLPRKNPSSQSSSPYFNAPSRKSDQYSIGFSFVPKRDINSEKLVWGNDFDHPVRDRLPPGFNYAFKIVKNFIDPGLECDAYADAPWLYGPALSCWFTLDIGDKVNTSSAGKVEWPELAKNGDVPLEESDSAGLRKDLGVPGTSSKRRKHFLDAAARKAFTFEKGRIYRSDFYNPYLDFNKFALKLPGFSLGVLKYIGDKTHTLRYVFKELGPGGPGDRSSGEVFLVVEMTLLFGDDHARGIEEDRQRVIGSNGHTEGLQETEDDDNEGQPELTQQWTKDEGFGQAGGATDMPDGDCQPCKH